MSRNIQHLAATCGMFPTSDRPDRGVRAMTQAALVSVSAAFHRSTRSVDAWSSLRSSTQDQGPDSDGHQKHLHLTWRSKTTMCKLAYLLLTMPRPKKTVPLHSVSQTCHQLEPKRGPTPHVPGPPVRGRTSPPVSVWMTGPKGRDFRLPTQAPGHRQSDPLDLGASPV